MNRTIATLCTTMSALAFCVPAHANTAWDEGIDGSFSDDPNAPTSIGQLQLGANDVTGTVNASQITRSEISPLRDEDFFTFTIGVGETLESIEVVSYDPDLTGFDHTRVAIDLGDTFTTGPEGDLYGYAYIDAPPGPGIGLNGFQDLLPEMGSSNGNFTPPLGAGEYTIWISDDADIFGSVYTLRLNVVPAPSAVGLACVGLLVGARRRRAGTS